MIHVQGPGVALLLFTLLLPGFASAQSPRQAGEALRKQLRAAGLDKRIAGEISLSGRLDASRAIGTLRLRTDLVKRGGTPIYRIQDRLTLSFPGLGAASLFVRADLRADLSPLEVVLESEEPRGRGTVATTRLELRREKTTWVRYASVGSATPTRTVLKDVPSDVLVLTPPLGAGERLVRLLEPRLGLRVSVRALDLETGQPTSFKASIDDQVTLRWAPKSKGPTEGFLVRRREAAADLRVVLGGRAHLVRLGQGGKARLTFRLATLLGASPDPNTPVAVVRRLLGAIARSDTKAVTACLDLPALHAAAGERGSLDDFQRVLLARLGDGEWLRRQGLDLAAEGSAPRDFEARPRSKPNGFEVVPVGAKTAGFVLTRHGKQWRVIRLPAAKRSR